MKDTVHEFVSLNIISLAKKLSPEEKTVNPDQTECRVFQRLLKITN